MEEKIKLELNKQELNVILFSLQKQSFELADPVIKSIVAQVQPQVQPIKEVK
jgi:hypothetical protein